MKTVITAEFTHAEELHLNQLGLVTERAGWGVTGEPLPQADLIAALCDAAVLITEHDAVTREVVEACPSLRLVVSCRGTPVGIDLAATVTAGIAVVNTSARNADAVADFTIGCIINAVRHITTSDRHHRTHGWNVDGRMPYLCFRGRELRNLSLGLVGLGAVGERVAKRARLGFDMRVMATTRRQHNLVGVEQVDLPTLLRESDVLSLHCPLTEDTRGLIGRDEISQMKPGSYLINVARGAVVDTDAVLAALHSQHLAAAVLDVYDPEPPPSSSSSNLFDAPRLTLTPHIAGASDDVVQNHSRSAVALIEDWLASCRLTTLRFRSKTLASLAKRSPGVASLNESPPRVDRYASS